MSKSLVVYYSRKGGNYFPGGIKSIEKGNTEIAAEFVAKAVDADLFEIEPVKPYSDDYNTCCDEAKAELKANARPAIKAFMDDFDAYDTIFVCYPNWWGTIPMCVLTFLDHYDLSGKTIAPLCTNEGSGLGNSVTDLKRNYPSAVFADGFALRGHQAAKSENAIAKWAKSIG